MSYHRFAVLTEQGESGITSAEFEALFTPDMTFFSPFLLKPLNDNKLAIRFINEIFAKVSSPRYTHQFTDDNHSTLFLWKGDLQGPDGRTFTLEGSAVITEGEDGLINRVVIYLRPLQVAALIIKPMVLSAASVLPKEYWDAVKPQEAK
jgi:hypothetical protein